MAASASSAWLLRAEALEGGEFDQTFSPYLMIFSALYALKDLDNKPQHAIFAGVAAAWLFMLIALCSDRWKDGQVCVVLCMLCLWCFV